MLALVLCLGYLFSTGAVHLPGVLPTAYLRGVPVNIKVNSLTSTQNIMPFAWYSMPWCAPSKEDRKKYAKSQNLGEVLWGDQIEISLFRAEMLVNDTCRKVCEEQAPAKEHMKLIETRIEQGYRGNMVLDGLPLGEEGSGKHSSISSAVLTGFPLGLAKKHSSSGNDTIIYNHLHFTIQYHKKPVSYLTEGANDEEDAFRIVGFLVTPYSIDHRKSPCNADLHPEAAEPVTTKDTAITWSYSVNWDESEIEWSTRWDVYMKSTPVESRIHWYSIMNSTLVVLLLSAIVAIIFIRALRKDMARYNDPENIEEAREETGWKLVHADVMRTPPRAGLLAVYVGTGAQLLGMSVTTLLFALFGFLSPANRGALLTALIFLFVLLGSYSGYTTARLAKLFKMRSWHIIFVTALYFPGQMFVCYFLLNMVHWGRGAASATPFTTMLLLTALWFCVSLPLVLLGAVVGYKRETIDPLLRVNIVPRTIPPQPWYLRNPHCILVPGILPFGAAFIESVFILSSVWQGRIYYVFGFLALVFVLLVLTCAEATIVMIYFQLLNEDYRWWWRSFLTSGSYGFWLFVYSAFYYMTALNIRAFWASVLYFGYMFMVSYFAFVLTGTIGFAASFIFVRRIYAAVRVD
jgi:transmembrane 9 superfamily protein 2/4